MWGETVQHEKLLLNRIEWKTGDGLLGRVRGGGDG